MSLTSSLAKPLTRALTNSLTSPFASGVTGYLTVSDPTPDEGDTITITFTQTSVGGTYTYQWYLDGDALDDLDIHIDGATTDELTVSSISEPSHGGSYTIKVTDTVTGAIRTFGPVVIVVTPTPDVPLLAILDRATDPILDRAADYIVSRV